MALRDARGVRGEVVNPAEQIHDLGDFFRQEADKEIAAAVREAWTGSSPKRRERDIIACLSGRLAHGYPKTASVLSGVLAESYPPSCKVIAEVDRHGNKLP